MARRCSRRRRRAPWNRSRPPARGDRGATGLIALALVCAARGTRADDAGAAAPVAPSARGAPVTETTASTPLDAPRGASRWLASAALGRALRFDNPYRLATPLGETPASVSATAPYVDLAVGWSRGGPSRIQHGAVLAWSVAVAGVRQSALAPGYLAVLRPVARWHLRWRLGPSAVLEPDPTVGWEAAVGGAWYARAGMGLTVELSGSVFYGAATREHERTTIPLAGLSFGWIVDYEVWR